MPDSNPHNDVFDRLEKMLDNQSTQDEGGWANHLINAGVSIGGGLVVVLSVAFTQYGDFQQVKSRQAEFERRIIAAESQVRSVEEIRGHTSNISSQIKRLESRLEKLEDADIRTIKDDLTDIKISVKVMQEKLGKKD